MILPVSATIKTTEPSVMVIVWVRDLWSCFKKSSLVSQGRPCFWQMASRQYLDLSLRNLLDLAQEISLHLSRDTSDRCLGWSIMERYFGGISVGKKNSPDVWVKEVWFHSRRSQPPSTTESYVSLRAELDKQRVLGGGPAGLKDSISWTTLNWFISIVHSPDRKS